MMIIFFVCVVRRSNEDWDNTDRTNAQHKQHGPSDISFAACNYYTNHFCLLHLTCGKLPLNVLSPLLCCVSFGQKREAFFFSFHLHSITAWQHTPPSLSAVEWDDSKRGEKTTITSQSTSLNCVFTLFVLFPVNGLFVCNLRSFAQRWQEGLSVSFDNMAVRWKVCITCSD